MPEPWLEQAIRAFGAACKQKLNGPGDREAAIRSPIEGMLGAAGEVLGVTAVFHDEVRDSERRVRPDYAVSVGGAIIGYIEVKAPGHGIDPGAFTGHNKRQWDRQKDLPNLIYTNGTEWRLYRDSELLVNPVTFTGGTLETAGSELQAPPEFEQLITDFLKWQASPITSVGALVRAVAPLTRLLRGEVLDQLASERRAVESGADSDDQPFSGLALAWRALLFPTADDETFADGYAQAVTFALLLARSEGISLTDKALHEVGVELGADHSLMGRALQLLTDDVAADFKVILDLLVRVVAAVQWDRVRSGRRDTYLHLYENFLDEYDKDLRKLSGSYYTPRDVVEEMTRLTEEVLKTRLSKAAGFRDPSVTIIDPAMGTGTFLHTILDRTALAAASEDGPGAVPGVIAQVANRLIGFEIQMGPYAVAELRATDLLSSHGSTTPDGGMHLYVTDTLDDPHANETQIGYGMQLIAKSRREANKIKADTKVTVVIGNPPYRERAEGMGGWVENGSLAHGGNAAGILDDFRFTGNGAHERHLKNLYVYFWRWSTWKVWESTPEAGDAGVVCFITTSGYVSGPGFKGMRKYLREQASEGWIIDLTPEGQTPDIPTRIFPGVRQPLAIGIFVRKSATDTQTPAKIHYRAVHGTQDEKFAAMRATSLDSSGWRDAREGWTDAFTPSSETAWDSYPALSDLQPWMGPGIKASRTWPFAPSIAILKARWLKLVSEPETERKRMLFKESPGVTLERASDPLPGPDTVQNTGPFSRENRPLPSPIRVSYRSFDRQWLIPDSRLMQRPGPLWHGRIPHQIFTLEQHAHAITGGPGIVHTNHIPDLHSFNGRGGRALPHLHPNGTPNLAPGLIEALGLRLGTPISARDLQSYIAGVVSNPGFTETFADELTTPGIRVPITKDFELFRTAVEMGEEIIWIQTYGDAFSRTDRRSKNIRFAPADSRQPMSLTAVSSMPETARYDDAVQIVHLGDGQFGPVGRSVWEYTVGGKNVIKSWFNYRKSPPGGKKSSPLDHVHVSTWDPDWTTEFIDLLTLLTRLVELEPSQAELLQRILAGEIFSRDELAASGVSWPETSASRKPKVQVARPEVVEQGQLAFDEGTTS